jgi:hypothetical protein
MTTFRPGAHEAPADPQAFDPKVPALVDAIPRASYDPHEYLFGDNQVRPDDDDD